MKTRTKLRELLKGNDIVITPGVYDCLTARIAESVGFTGSQIVGQCDVRQHAWFS